MRSRIPAVALAAASVAARLGPGPGLGSTSPSLVRLRIHPLGPSWRVLPPRPAPAPVLAPRLRPV
eukprot:15462443-Alexandrium_andersonii.AAC.1